MFYSIVHHTHHDYSESVSETQMEVRTMPRSDGVQRCLSFELTSDPKANMLEYQDYLGNTVHHFDVPGKHQALHLTAKALVEVVDDFPALLPMGAHAWGDIDRLAAEGDNLEMVMPSKFVQSTPRLLALARELKATREGNPDPGALVRRLNSDLFRWLKYVPKSTKVDSPIEEALEQRRGVCQDFSHILLSLLRQLGIPARYVSGYFFELAPGVTEGATHAWVEALLPGAGWIGLDPANDILTGARHVRVAYGRDYADVPPTRGVFKGSAESEIRVRVQVKELKDRPRHAFVAFAEEEA